MERISIEIFVPQKAGQGNLPAAVVLADRGEAASIVELLAERCLVAAVCGENGASARQLMEAVLKKLQKYSVDFCRLYLIGQGALSQRAWEIAGIYSRILAGCRIFGGAEQPVPVRAARFLPVLASEGQGDRPFLARDFVYSLRTAGSRQAQLLPGTPGFGEEDVQWLLRQTKAEQYEVHWLQPGLWSIEAGAIESLYLVEGKDKALAVDTGMNTGKLMPLLRTLTQLPIELALTHAHGDHMLHADEFETVYCSPNEALLPREFLDSMMPDRKVDFHRYLPLKEGDRIDLGGVEIEALEAFGHTPGSLVFVDHQHKCLFSGDAFGSGIGVLMAIPGALPLSQLLATTRHFLSHEDRLKDYVWYGGHRIQEFGEQKMGEYYNPLNFDTVRDLGVLCEKLLAHDRDLPCQPGTNGWMQETVYQVSYQKAAMWVVPSKIC